MLRTEPKDKYDQGASAILELVDGARDMRFMMTAAAVAKERAEAERLGILEEDAVGEGAGGETAPRVEGLRDLTAKNMAKVTRYRKNGVDEFEALVGRMKKMGFGNEEAGKKLDGW